VVAENLQDSTISSIDEHHYYAAKPPRPSIGGEPSRNPMVSFLTLERSANQAQIKQSRNRIKHLNQRIMNLGNGKDLMRNVLH
jgi:hypothetical protein